MSETGSQEGADNITLPEPPIWGSLPVEQYLIRNWDYTSPLTTDEQIEKLVSAFVEEDQLPDDYFLPASQRRAPTPDEIRTILEPFRPQKLRRIAAAMLCQAVGTDFFFTDTIRDSEAFFGVKGYGPSETQFFFLRTHYAEDPSQVVEDGRKLRRWWDRIVDEGYCREEDRWFHLLDDPEWFDLGENWMDVYAVLPELALQGRERQLLNEERAQWAIWCAEEELEDLRKGGEELDEERVTEVWKEAVRQHVADWGPPWLVLVDHQSFEDNTVFVMFRDKKGNIVKQAEYDGESDNLEGFVMDMNRGRQGELFPLYTNGDLYKSKRKLMRELTKQVRERHEASKKETEARNDGVAQEATNTGGQGEQAA
ncbi:hypothetical protein VTJ04DRAFT_921 [Mycothermus thermophilus]|uniref:uncharacterized protein n=1 Tax=Humicola insolens TaxID=85995 RepID=UPI0037421FE2